MTDPEKTEDVEEALEGLEALGQAASGENDYQLNELAVTLFMARLSKVVGRLRERVGEVEEEREAEKKVKHPPLTKALRETIYDAVADMYGAATADNLDVWLATEQYGKPAYLLRRERDQGGGQSDFNRWEIFKALRGAYGCSVREVAERTGVSASYVSEVENGNAGPSYRYVVKFAEAFDLYRDWLLMRAGHLPSSVARCRPSVADVKGAMHALGYRSEPATHDAARRRADRLEEAVREAKDDLDRAKEARTYQRRTEPIVSARDRLRSALDSREGVKDGE